MAEYATQAIGDRQAQPQSFLRAGLVTVQALEFFEDHLLFIQRDAGATVPHFQAQLALASAYAQQYRAVGITESVGQKILQDAPQQLDIAVDAQATAAQAETQALLLGQRFKLRAQGVEQFVKHKRLALRIDLAVFQA